MIHERLDREIRSLKPEIIDLQRLLLSRPALAPENGGEGEIDKAVALGTWLEDRGLGRWERLDAPDGRVESGIRPNARLRIPGRGEGPALWIMTHLDVVPPGEGWTADPYELRVEGDKLVGRGAEDNHQGLCSSVAAALALKRSGLVPAAELNLLFVADEEVYSEFGIRYLLENHDLFSPGDRVLVPDGGEPDSSIMMVAEKGVLWLKVTVKGKQCHASMPELGVNAFLAASDLALRIEGIDFGDRNELFSPSTSTLVPTRHEENVPNVNTIPGEDVFYVDCRVLPATGLDAALAAIHERIAEVQRERGVTVTVEVLDRVESPPTAADCSLVRELRPLVKDEYGVEPRAIGIGGATVAAYLRQRGIEAVVWATLDESAHMPEEYCRMRNLLGDARVMAKLALGEG
jgi:succinyl-diaminopimelate desuccinylase